jgi:dienelactone hydrolase
MSRLGFLVVLLSCLLPGCAETPRQRAHRLEPVLSAADFHMVPADTPERLEELASHTPLKMRFYFVNGKPHYWFADPYVCNCVYVGNETDFQKYEQLELQQQMVEREQTAAAMNENAAQEEQFNWMMWPPSPYFY